MLHELKFLKNLQIIKYFFGNQQVNDFKEYYSKLQEFIISVLIITIFTLSSFLVFFGLKRAILFINITSTIK
jgi:hypothetical protein